MIKLTLVRLLAALVLVSATAWGSGGVTEPAEAVAAGSGEQCVEPIPYMRRNHMELIKHQRIKTVHQGIRTQKHSLANCVECHARKDSGGESIPVNAKGEFCAACHQRTAVHIDCFQCHATVPAAGANPHQEQAAWHKGPDSADVVATAAEPASSASIQGVAVGSAEQTQGKEGS